MVDYWRSKVAFSVVVYCLSVSAVPIYNKKVFSSGVGGQSGGLQKFPYPIATAFIQLATVAVALSLANVTGHLCCRCSGSRRGGSWLFGPHFAYKLRHVAPVGLLFGLKYGITNWGLQLMPTGTHLLLQSTDLLWTVVTARIWNKERLGLLEHVAAVLVTIGSLTIGIHAGSTLDAPAIPLLVNCLTPLVLALCISTLRSGAKELFDPGNILGGSVTPTEFTALKLGLSAAVAFALSMVLEGGGVRLADGRSAAWWTALREEPPKGMLFLLSGSVFVLIFQVNITWLSGLTSAVTVGIVGGLKVVPQWLLNALFHFKVDLSPLNVIGAALVLSASILYAVSISLEYRLTVGLAGLEWQPWEGDGGSPRWEGVATVPASPVERLWQRGDSKRRLLTNEGILDSSLTTSVKPVGACGSSPDFTRTVTPPASRASTA